MASGQATVKAVNSGDTLTIVGKPSGGPPPELTLTLASIMAPKLARGPQQEDEPWAWESREYLRTLLIGQTVTFKVLQTMKYGNTTRTFADVTMGDGTNVAKMAVDAGWAQVKDNRDGITSVVFEDLPALEEAAKMASKGMWQPGSGVVRAMQWSPSDDEVRSIVDNAMASNAPVDVVVEYVRDGGCMRALVLEKWAMLTLVVAGVMTPRAGQAPEPFSLQARHFTEMRLLHRKVQVLLHGVDKNGNALCTILHPKGNIATEMLRSGLARVADRTLALIPKDAVMFRKAELEAKQAQRCLFGDYIASALLVRAFKGIVLEVTSGDTVLVSEDLEDGTPADPLKGTWTETKVSLSSIRVNRLGNGRTGVVDEPWAAEARDFVKARLVGNRVSVTHEFTKDGRAFASIHYLAPSSDGSGAPVEMNIATQLVSNGLAVLTKNVPVEDGQRLQAAQYDEMLLAESAAICRGRGIHGQTEPPIRPKLQDLSTDGKRAKERFNGLCAKHAALRYRAIIEHVYAGSRFKVSIPSEGVQVQFSLIAVRAPLLSRGATESKGVGKRDAEPLANEARRFSRAKLMQRMVDIEILDCDKNGIFLGQLASAARSYASSSSAPTLPYALPMDTFANVLVRQGLARSDKFGMQSLSSEMAQEKLRQEEEVARRSGYGLWSFVKEVEAEVVDSQINADTDPGLPAPSSGVTVEAETMSPPVSAPPGLVKKTKEDVLGALDLDAAFPSLGLQPPSGNTGGAWGSVNK